MSAHDQDTEHPCLLPHECHTECITAGDLARMLTRKGIISAEEFGWLVTKGYFIPKLEATTEKNWMAVRDDLLAFLSEGEREK